MAVNPIKYSDQTEIIDSQNTDIISIERSGVFNYQTKENFLKPVDERFDTTELTLARQGQDLASVKQALQQGNGATLDFSGIGTVALDARATGRANPTVKGRTATNIVDGADIANLGTVTFASVLNHKYFDVLHGTILTGTGSDMTVTNDTGATADIAVIYLSGVYGLGNEPSEADCAKIFSYFDCTKSITLPARIISKSEDESKTSTLYIADSEELQSVPAISDEVKVVNGQLVKVQNVQRYVLQSADINQMEVKTTVTGAIVQLPSDAVNVSISDPPKLAITGITFGATSHLSMDSITYIGTWGGFSSPMRKICIFFALGTSLAEAKAALAGTVIYYQLATPIITPLTTSGILQAKTKGTVYFEPYYEGSHRTDASSQITLPYEGTIEAVYGYDENLVEYLLDSSEYSLTGTTLTITGALENEVWFVKMSRSEPLAPEMEVNVINNEQVIADTSNGKFYKLVPTITNGALVSQTPVEVL